MRCTKHIDREAAAQCAKCGAGVCAQCAEATSILREDCGILCTDCYCSELRETAEYYKKNNGKRLTRIIVSVILYLIGWAAIICGLTEKPVFIPAIVIGVLLCGIYTGITWRKAAKDSHDAYEREHGATYTVTDSGVYKKDGFLTKLIFFIIGTILGVAVTPVRVIIDIVARSKNKKHIKALNEAIAEASAI